MKKYLMTLLAAGILGSCSTATEVDELSPVQGNWELTSIGGRPVAMPERYTIVFDADGSFNARADCNQCSGSYTTNGNAISTGGAIACTRAFCPPPSFFDEYSAALASMSSYTRAGSELTIRYAGGELVYRVND